MKRVITAATLSTLAFVLFISAGCRKTSARQYLQQYYQVNYDGGNTYALAGFLTSNGTYNVTLQRGDKVTANGMNTDVSAVHGGGNYTWDLGGAKDVTFALEVDGTTLINTLTQAMVGNIDFTVDSVFSVGDTIRLSWTGGALTADEASFTMGTFGSTGQYYSAEAGTFSGETFTFDPAQTNKLLPGQYIIYMMKYKTFPLQQNDNGANGHILARVMAQKNIIIR